ncbi:MAG: type II secretion system F family protein [Desulfobacterales bacterium]|nr:type II secretion system F family protein [Desulfobacterales bacterium]
MTPLLIFLFVFFIFFPAFLGLTRGLEHLHMKAKTRQRLKKMVVRKTGLSGTPAIRPPGAATGGHRPGGAVHRLEYLLISAGIRMTAGRCILALLCTGTALSVITGLITGTIVLPAAVFILSLGLPVLFLVFKKKQMEKQIIRELPEAIGIIVRALQIGRHVDGALTDAAQALCGPLSVEIKIIYQEMAMGFTFDQAFNNFENRYGNLSDIKLFCTAFVIQRETGGNLVQILESLADTVTKRFRFQRKIKTYTAEARASAVIIALLPFIFGVATWFFNPDYIHRLTGTGLGKIMIYAAVFLEITGFAVMRKMAGLKL